MRMRRSWVPRDLELLCWRSLGALTFMYIFNTVVISLMVYKETLNLSLSLCIQTGRNLSWLNSSLG